MLHAALLAFILVRAIIARFRLPQYPFIDNDFWGYLNPALSALSGHGFVHTQGRDSLYPGFVYAVLKLGGDLRAVSVVQHLVGLATGVLMLVAYRRVSRLLRSPGYEAWGIVSLFGLLPAALYLTSPATIRYENCIRPEEIFPFFVVLSICLNLEFIQRRWVAPAPKAAAWLGAAQLAVSVVAYKLKPSFGFAVFFANVPLLASLVRTGMPARNKALMAGGGAMFCVLFLLLPESLLKRRDENAAVFLPDTLLTIHAEMVHDQIAADIAANRPSPFAPATVRSLLARLDTQLPVSRRPENDPYPSLGCNPDYLLYTDCVCDGVTQRTHEGNTERAALGMYYYKRAFLHQPGRMLEKIWNQMEIFYHFGSLDRRPILTYTWHMMGTRLLGLEQDYRRNVALSQRPRFRKYAAIYPPAQRFIEASARLSDWPLSIEQKPIMTVSQKILELLYLPGLLAALFIAAWPVYTGRRHTDRLLPALVALLTFSYNFGNVLTIAVVHSLDVERYVENQLAFTLLAAASGLLVMVETVRRLAGGLVVAATASGAAGPSWLAASVSAPAPAFDPAHTPSGELLLPSLCVLIPCYNEATSIAAVVAEYRAVFPSARLLVVDNASSDGTAAAARTAGADVISEPGKGKARAVVTALTHIDSEVVLMVDGDGSYPAEGGRRLFESYLAQPADLITGIRNRAESADGSFRPFHQGGTHLFGKILGWVFGWQAEDLFSGLRLFSRRFYENVPILSRGFELELELTVQAIDKGFAMRELPVPFGRRAEGTQSKLRTIQDGSRILRLLLVLFRDYRPLWCFSSAAGVFFVLSLLAGSAPIHDYLATRYVTHLPLAVLAASLMVLAFLCLQTGLVLESGLRQDREATQLRIRDSARRARRG